MADKKIVVTGATGFIGNAVCKALVNTPGISVIPVSRKKHDRDFFFSKNYYELPKGDACIHLGEDSDRIRVNKNGESYRFETGRVIESILGNGYAHILYASSAAVYGTSGRSPYTEEDVVVGSDEYSLAKLNNEAEILAAGAAVIRLTNVVGPRMAGNNVLSDIIKQLPGNGPLILRNSQPIRDFIWLYDAVDAIIRLTNELVPGLFNVGTGEEMSIQNLAKTCLKIDGQRQREVVGLVDSPPYSYNVVNIGKIRGSLGWTPSLNLVGSIGQILRDRSIN